MTHYFIILTLLMVFSIVYKRIAIQFNIIDVPNARSSHNKPVISGGGILFVFSLFLFFVISDFSHPYFALGTLLLAIISFIDDINPLSPKVRLIIQFVGVMLIFQELDIWESPLWTLPLATIISIGFLNIYNFMDGINGITGFYSIILTLGFLLFDTYKLDFIQDNILIYTLIALFVFGFYNFRRKARFFAGDVGSITLAMIMLFVGIKFIIVYQSPLVLLFIMVYGADSILTILRRAVAGENILEPHRKHLFHNMVDKTRFTHLQVAGIYATLQAMLIGIAYYAIEYLTISAQYGLVLAMGLLFFILYFVGIFRYGKQGIRAAFSI